MYHWFEHPLGVSDSEITYPIYVFINHNMQIYKLKHSAPPNVANLYIQQMFDNMNEALVNNDNYDIPYNYVITNVYPNPFNPVVHINFDIPWAGTTQIEILDISGSHIETLHSGFLQSGSHELSWNAESMPSGVYLVSLKSGNKIITEKVVLLK